MQTRIEPRGVRALDERGVAMPVALFGLVAVSLLITTALTTSSTEVALSRAHQEGTRSLYAADAALEEFVAQRAAMATDLDQRFFNGAFDVTTYAGDPYSVVVSELFTGNPTTLPNGDMERHETYSLVAEPKSGRGRAVGALVEVMRTAASVALNVDSGLTLGTNATIAGSATISDGSSAGAPCDSVAAPAAITHADGTTVKEQGNGHDIYGDIVKDGRDAAELMNHVFDGKSIDDLDDLAHIRFGPMYGQPLFSGSPNQTASNALYRWGCPIHLVSGCNAQQSGYFPAVAIDANGGTVDITGDHGQGVLIVRNGEIHIRGNFKFAGIIIAEGTLRISGTPKIEGAVIAVGDEAVIDPGEETVSTGNSLIRFNKCEIVSAQLGLTMQSLDFADQTIETPTFAWYEVVR